MKFLTPPGLIELIKEYVSAIEAYITEDTDSKIAAEKQVANQFSDIDEIEKAALEEIESREEQILFLNLKDLIIKDYSSNLFQFISTYSLFDPQLERSVSAGEIMNGTNYYTQQLKPISLKELHPAEWDEYEEAKTRYQEILNKAKEEFRSLEAIKLYSYAIDLNLKDKEL